MSGSDGPMRMPWWWSSSTLMAMATSRERAPDAPGQKEDERHEDEPDGDRPALGECAQPVFQQQEGAGADEGRHDHHLPRRDPVEGFDGHDSQAEGVERAREAREERGKDEGQVLDPPDVIAARRRAVAVLTDRPEHGAEGRVEDPLEPGNGETHQRESEVVKGERALDADLPAEEVHRQLRNAAQSIVAARDVGQVEGDEVQELGEGQREHGEVDAAAPQTEETDGRAAQDGEERPRPEPQPERAQLELGKRDARAVGAEAVVGGVAEGQESRIAVEEIEAQREQAEDQHLRGKRLVGDQEREDGEEDSERPHRMAAQPSSDSGRAGHPHSMSPASPKKPLGRTRRTSAITTKTMISASLGAKKVVMPTTCPIMIPATTAPSRLPIPPTTTTTNDSMTMVTPISA